jgi:hypothetical protein
MRAVRRRGSLEHERQACLAELQLDDEASGYPTRVSSNSGTVEDKPAPLVENTCLSSPLKDPQNVGASARSPQHLSRTVLSDSGAHDGVLAPFYHPQLVLSLPKARSTESLASWAISTRCVGTPSARRGTGRRDAPVFGNVPRRDYLPRILSTRPDSLGGQPHLCGTR